MSASTKAFYIFRSVQFFRVYCTTRCEYQQFPSLKNSGNLGNDMFPFQLMEYWSPRLAWHSNVFMRVIWNFRITSVGATLDDVPRFYTSDTHGQPTSSSFFILPAFDSPIHDCSVFLVTLSKEYCSLLRVYSVFNIVS